MTIRFACEMMIAWIHFYISRLVCYVDLGHDYIVWLWI